MTIRIRGNFQKRDQHKLAATHPRVRQLQLRRVAALFLEGEDVDIEQPWSTGDCALLRKTPFDRARSSQQFRRVQGRFHLDHTVQEIGLRQIIHGRRFVQLRTAHHGYVSGSLQPFQCLPDVLAPVAQI